GRVGGAGRGRRRGAGAGAPPAPSPPPPPGCGCAGGFFFPPAPPCGGWGAPGGGGSPAGPAAGIPAELLSGRLGSLGRQPGGAGLVSSARWWALAAGGNFLPAADASIRRG